METYKEYALSSFPHSENLKNAIEEGKDYEVVYGFFTGGDPRDFEPDYECCSQKEIARWRDAVEQWNNGLSTEYEGSHRWIVDKDVNVVGTTTVAIFGIGLYLYVYDESECEESEAQS